MESVYKSLTKEIEKLQELEGTIQKRFQAYQQLATQLSENENVEQDLAELKEGENKVYKLIGPVLVEQSLEEARDTVKKRLQYIQDEM